MGQINQYERAMRAWVVLAEVAAARGVITYGDLAAKLGVTNPKACRYFLDPIQSYCLINQIPPLTILVVTKGKKKPGVGFIAHDTEALNEGMAQVWGYDWKKGGNPFDFAESGETLESLTKKLIEDPNTAEVLSSLVRNRGMRQVVFRAALMKAYEGKCALTGLAFTELLEACHIVPWAECTPAQQIDVRNGILLNRLHHRMFDTGYMTIDENYDVHIDQHKSLGWGRDQVRNAIAKDLNGTRIALPARKEHWPDPGLLAKHSESWGWEFTDA